ncbi:MAG: ABC transporter substrate-binding protein [Candidatus Entotheonellia bacterium]
MKTQPVNLRQTQGMSRRDLLKAGLAAGATLSAWPLYGPQALWGGEAGVPKRGGILRVRGWDPPHFDTHLTINNFTNNVLSFTHSRLVRHKVGADVQPGTFIVEPDVAERWEALDDTTYVFHLRQGVKWHNKSPLNGRELVADDVKFTYDRFLTERGNANRYMLEPLDRVEVVDRYTVKFLLKEPFVWLVNTLAYPWSMWIVAPELVQQYGDLKKAETAIGTGPFVLERYEPNVKAVFKRHPEYFRKDQPYVDGVEWLIIPDESTGLAMYRTGQLDLGPQLNWAVRQQDLDALKKSHPHLIYQDFLGVVPGAVFMRVDMAPFSDVRVRRAISHAIDRQGLIEAVWGRGEPTAAVARGLAEWALPIEQLGEGAKYYRYDPKEARRLLAEAGYPKGFKTQLTVTGGLSRDLIDDAQLVQRYLKDVGIEAELKIQEHGAYMATTMQGKFGGMVRSPFGIAWEPDAPLYRTYAADSSWNAAHLNDPAITAMLKEQRRTKDLEARRTIIYDIQRYAAEHQYYVYTNVVVITGSWAPYVKNYGPNHTFDYGSRAAALWLER